MAWTVKAKIGLGMLLSYTSFEIYMQLRTQYVIYQRKRAMATLNEDPDVTRFRLVTVSGMFVNPFSEYRPQTAFEFMLVRLMELLELVYGSHVEVHEKLPHPHNGATEVEDLLKRFEPSLQQLRQNSIILQKCLESGDFSAYNSPPPVESWTKDLRDADDNQIKLPPVADQMLFTWLGQSCGLLQIGGINFLTDPQIGDHLMLTRFGPKRLIKSPMDLDDIKQATNGTINFVLVSHDHPDHLEMALIPKIANHTTWIVPLGFKKTLARRGVHNVIEMDWWDTLDLNPYIHHQGNINNGDKYELVFVPAMHWSGRYVLDSNTTLWGSYIVRKNGQLLAYHAGDTGYCNDLFEVIGRKYGPTFLSLLPIGQYCPSWHQKPRHISPMESLDICKHIQCKYMKGVHWGTFKLSGEPIMEPKNLLQKHAEEQGKEDCYKTPEFGLTYMYDLKAATETPIHF